MAPNFSQGQANNKVVNSVAMNTTGYEFKPSMNPFVPSKASVAAPFNMKGVSFVPSSKPFKPTAGPATNPVAANAGSMSF